MEKPVKGSSSQNPENVESGVLRTSHREFLLARHGTLDLVPLPSEFPEDPLNWPSWRKNINLFMVSFHAMMCLIMGAGIIPAYSDMAEELGVSLQAATYFTSMQIAMLGGKRANTFILRYSLNSSGQTVAPLVWRPFSTRIGMRPIWLIGTFCAAICNVGCARSKSYGAMAISRLLVAFFIAPAMALGTKVVTQMFFSHQRGQKMGIWTYVGLSS